MRVAIFYATREGQTHRIAEHIATGLRAHSVEADVFNVRQLHAPLDWSSYSTACVAASVHIGHHEPEMITFVKNHRHDLERLSAAFLSVTLSEAGAEDHTQPPERRQQSAADAHRMVEVFVEDSGWRPAHALCVAGALKYSQYNFFIKLVMKHIARKAGAPTDTSRDYEFTDWWALDRFVEEVVREIAARRQEMPRGDLVTSRS
jgi:menaquinone-dependent protoporphyrinogen oxidase